MVATLVDRVSTSWPDEVPHPYKRFLSNICKLSSVAGYLQVLSVEPLNFLKDFCHQMLDIRSAANNLKMKLMLEEMPAVAVGCAVAVAVGCACPQNITYGFEIMLFKESAHNIFRLLMCKDVVLHALQGVIFDNPRTFSAVLWMEHTGRYVDPLLK